MGLYTYKSETITYAAGRRRVEMDFVPRRGERGGRNVIHRIDVRCNGQFDTGAGVTLAARDLIGAVRQVEVRDASGYRRNLRGPMLKIHYQEQYGRRSPDDAAALIANTADQVRNITVPLVFARPDEFAPDDNCMAVDDLLDGGEFALTMPDNSQLNWAGGTGSVDPVTTYEVLVHCREEFDVQFHSRDEANFLRQESAATVRLPVLGNLLRSLFLHLDAAGGGTTVTTITDVTFDALRYIVLGRDRIKQHYLLEHDTTRVLADDLVYNDLAMPLIFPHKWSKMRDHVRIDGTLLGRLTSTMAASDMVYHLITPKDQRLIANAMAVNGVREGAPITVKTKGKSMKDPTQWGQFGLFMPWKAGR